jgi:retinal rod rhodopsin-sensitive cGMP 3',5'-cyclic phosphodiesterase subunit delta
MNIRNADTGSIVWESRNWSSAFTSEMKVQVPASILSLRAVSREMNFTSEEEINNFRLIQSVYLHGQPLEEWRFTFGFVIPGSTNSWQCVIESAGQDQMLPANILSGNVTIETSFYDGDMLVSKTSLRVYYV